MTGEPYAMSDVERQRAARRVYYRSQQGPFWKALSTRMDQNPDLADADEGAIFAALFEKAALAAEVDRLDWDELP